MSTQSTIQLQEIVDDAQAYGDIHPILNVGGQTLNPALRIATDVMNAICAASFPHKWNEVQCPLFYTNSFQQDYAVVNPDGTSLTNLAWLERGVVFDVNNTAIPKPFRPCECGRQLPQASGTFWNSATNSPMFVINWFPNYMLYYGTWGAANIGTSSLGNNPGPGSIYKPPTGYRVMNATWSLGQTMFALNAIPGGLTAGSSLFVNNVFPIAYNNTYTVVSVSGLDVLVTGPVADPSAYQSGGVVSSTSLPASISMPANPIIQIRDANGNLLVLTQYGTEGTTAPLLPPYSPAGTTVSASGATTVWTSVDPNGQGFRILPVPSQTGVVWEFNLVGQKKPVRFTSLGQTLDPLPDDFESHFRQGFIARCYKYSPLAKVSEKFKIEWPLWLASLTELRAKEDRELEENVFSPERGIMGGRRSSRWAGAAWPFGYPGR